VQIPKYSLAATIIKSSPLDIELFRQETSVKYPTFTPPPPPPADPSDPPILKPIPVNATSRLAQAYSPIPVRHHYHHDDAESHSGLPNTSSSFQQTTNGPFRTSIQPPTPVPTPPPAGPKPKKLQYQTDQGRPFLFPFSKTQGRDARLVPFAIDEADKLYNKHMYVSLSLYQMWKTREDCMTFESGLDHMPGTGGEFQSSTFVNKVYTVLYPWSRHSFLSLGPGNRNSRTTSWCSIAWPKNRGSRCCARKSSNGKREAKGERKKGRLDASETCRTDIRELLHKPHERQLIESRIRAQACLSYLAGYSCFWNYC